MAALVAGCAPLGPVLEQVLVATARQQSQVWSSDVGWSSAMRIKLRCAQILLSLQQSFQQHVEGFALSNSNLLPASEVLTFVELHGI